LYFCSYDTGHDKFIDFNELKVMMEKLGCPQTHLGLKAMIKEVDEDNDGKISFREVSYCKALLQYITTVHYYSTLLQYITTVHYYSTLLQYMTTVHYYSTLLQYITTVHYYYALLQCISSIHYCNALLYITTMHY